MTKLRVPNYIGVTDRGRKVILPAEAATQGFAILGKRGKGKSTLAADMIEGFASRGTPFVIFDPPGAHWGIRYAADKDGKPIGPSGFRVLLVGGEHGDVPLDPTGGKELAALIVDTNLSCVIDMKEMNYTALQRYFADFSEEMFRINRTVRTLIFEEAQNIAPQQLKFDEQKRALYATEKLIDEGRGIGLGFLLISQRPAAVNKSVLTQIDNLMVLGMFAPQDIEQVEDWFKYHVKGENPKQRQANLRALMDDIATMKMGECWFLSPEWRGEMTRFHIRQRVTYHAGRTPKPGERPVNLRRFSIGKAVDQLKKMYDAKKQQRQVEIKDLAEANKKIRELERKLKTIPAPAAVPVTKASARNNEIFRKYGEAKELLREIMKIFVKVNAVGFENSALTADQLKRVLESTGIQIAEIARKNLERNQAEFETLKKSTNRLLAQVQRILKKENLEVSVDVAHIPAQPQQVQVRAALPLRAEVAPMDVDGITGPMRKILNALSELLSIGKLPAPKEMVAAWASYNVNGGGFNNPLGALKTMALVDYPVKGQILLTDEGMKIAGVKSAPTQSEIENRILGTLDGPQRKILAVLLPLRGSQISKEDLAAQSGYNVEGGGFNNPLGWLRTAGFIEYPVKGQVKAMDWLFVEG